MPEDVRDAEQLRLWFRNFSFSLRYIKKNKILQRGPACVRKKNRLEAALSLLEVSGALGVITCGRITCIDLYPALPPDVNKLYFDIGSNLVDGNIYKSIL